MVNELSRNPVFFLRYSPPKPFRISHTPHSHSILSARRNALIYKRKFFLALPEVRTTSRQNFSLLISKEKLRDSNFVRLRQLSPTIGRFFRVVDRGAHSG